MEIRKRVVGECVVFSWDAPLNLEGSASKQLKEELKSAITEGASSLVLDLASVEFIDSSGLGALISALKSVRTAGGTLALARLSGPVRNILEITRLDRVFDMLLSIEEACERCEASMSTEL